MSDTVAVDSRDKAHTDGCLGENEPEQHQVLEKSTVTTKVSLHSNQIHLHTIVPKAQESVIGANGNHVTQ